MASAESEAITGVWSGGQGAKPPEAERFFVDVRP